MAELEGYGGEDFATEEGKYHDRMIGHHEAIKKHVKKDGSAYTDHDIAQTAHGAARDAHEVAHISDEGDADASSDYSVGNYGDGLSRVANHISTRLGVHDEPEKKAPSVGEAVRHAVKDAENLEHNPATDDGEGRKRDRYKPR